MIEIKAPAKAVKGELIACTYAVTGKEEMLLQKGGGVEVELVVRVNHARETPIGKLADPDSEITEIMDLYSDVFNLGEEASGSFNLQLPKEFPASYHGKLFLVGYFIIACVSSPGGAGDSVSCEVEVT